MPKGKLDGFPLFTFRLQIFVVLHRINQKEQIKINGYDRLFPLIEKHAYGLKGTNTSPGFSGYMLWFPYTARPFKISQLILNGQIRKSPGILARYTRGWTRPPVDVLEKQQLDQLVEVA